MKPKRDNEPSGHIERRGEKWRVVIEAPRHPSTGKRRRIVRSGIPGYHEARRVLRQLLTDLDEQRFVRPSQVSVIDYLVEWLKGHSMVAAENTLDVYEVQVKAYVAPRIGAIPLQDLTPSHLDAMYADLLRRGRRDGSGLALKTVRNVHVMLHRAIEDALATDRIKRNPAARAKPPTPKKARRPASERSVWNRDHAEAFLAHVANDRLAALYMLALTTGMRRSEVLGLPWNHVDLQDGSLAVVQALVEVNHQPTLKPIPKTDRSRRRLALDPATVHALQAHRVTQLEERLELGNEYRPLGFVFARQDGTALRPSWVSRSFARLAAEAGLPDLSPRPLHGLRHTYGTLALEAGVPIEVISKRLGHASIAITADIYQHVRPGVDRDAAEAVARLIFGDPHS